MLAGAAAKLAEERLASGAYGSGNANTKDYEAHAGRLRLAPRIPTTRISKQLSPKLGLESDGWVISGNPESLHRLDTFDADAAARRAGAIARVSARSGPCLFTAHNCHNL